MILTIILTVLLALILFVDAIASFKPVAAVADSLRAVNFPRDWWWSLIVIKLLAAAGLIVGLIWQQPLIVATTAVAIVVYFICASWAHIKTKTLDLSFWVGCIGLTVLGLAVLLLTLNHI